MSKVYHGTTTKNLPYILKQGLRGSKSSFTNRVYVAIDSGLPEDIAQISAKEDKSEPVILVIKTNKVLHKDKEYEDEFESYYVIGAILPSEIIDVVIGKPSGYGDFVYKYKKIK